MAKLIPRLVNRKPFRGRLMQILLSTTVLLRLTLSGAVLIALLNTASSLAQTIDGGTTVTVPGTQSSPWNIAGSLSVGNTSTGTLQIGPGGIVSSGSGFIGRQATGTGTVTVSGAGAQWTSGPGLSVGNFGNGTLNITNGGRVTSTTNSYIAVAAGSTGAATVSGAGSQWNTTSDLRVGNTGNGTLQITGGAVVSNTLGYVGFDPAGIGTVTVSGSGSRWNNSSNLSVGSSGTGTLNVTNGGGVSSVAGLIGSTATARGAVTVDGAGSTWTNSSTLTVGTFGTGTLTISNNGTVSAVSATVAANSGSNGTINIGAAATDPAAAPGTLALTGPTPTVTLGANGLLVFNHTDNTGSYEFSPLIAGAGKVETYSGITVLTADNTYTGGTRIAGGTLQLGNGGTTGSIVGNVANNGTLVFNRSNLLTFGGLISGTGSVDQNGTGTTVLTAGNSYTGPTTVSAGALYIDGNQSAATGPTSVANGATLGGSGTVGGDVTLADGATLSPGGLSAAPGTLAINGDLSLGSASLLAYSFGQANVVGGPLNDLVTVGGDLVLDGTLNVVTTPGGSFDTGIYRVISYAGSLTDNGLAVGTIPSPNFFVQTSVSGQVNLVNTNGLTLNYWDGAAGPKNDGVVNGGDGLWQTSAGNDNWTNAAGTPNAPFTDGAFAIFTGMPGTVIVDNSLGAVTASGMQFAIDGYLITGDTLTLVDAPLAPGVSVIRVGDGTSAGSGYTATIDAVLAGSTELVKVDLGTLVLNGANTYSGGTQIQGGTISIATDGNLGAATGGLVFDGGTLLTTADLTSARATTTAAGGGTIETAAATQFIHGGTISGPGALTKSGAGILTLLADNNSYSGATNVNEGILQAGVAMTFSPNSAVNVAAAGTLDLNGFNQTVAGVTNAGLISMGPGTPPGTTLVTPNYVGQNGMIAINTRLGPDGSPSDRLVIDGGVASGASSILVRNVGGLGALTTGNGILVIDAINGATTAAGAFTLGNPGGYVAAGPYAYTLFRSSIDGSGLEDWYLRSTLDCTLDPTSPQCQTPNPPHYRPEVSTDTAVPELALRYGAALLDTLHQRMGEERFFNRPVSDDSNSLVWGRIIGVTGRRDGSPQGVLGDEGPDYDYGIYALQSGLDLYQEENANGSVDHGGIYAAFGRVTADVDDIDGSSAGEAAFDGVTLGGYWTHIGKEGWYFDAVAQGTWYDVSNDDSPADLDLETNGFGLGASLETGYPFRVDGEWVIEPQAQLVFQTISLDDANDGAATIRYSDIDSLTGRLGVRLAWTVALDPDRGDRRFATTWLRASLINEFLADPTTEFSSQDGSVPFHTDMKGLSAQLNLGSDVELERNLSLYGSAGSEISLEGDGQNFNGKLGLKVAF